MKSFVIAIKSMEESLEIANRCINSGKKHGIDDIQIFDAITPQDNPEELMKSKGMSVIGFQNNSYSRYENALACFMSHYSLWEMCANSSEDFFILEHDAVIIKSVAIPLKYNFLISLGMPSYGKIRRPNSKGIGPLRSKIHLPGAHAYMLKPDAAAQIIEKTKVQTPRPTDVFLNRRLFPKIQELYPWPVVVHDTFSTVQQVKGCEAKHSYKRRKGFEIKKV